MSIHTLKSLTLFYPIHTVTVNILSDVTLISCSDIVIKYLILEKYLTILMKVFSSKITSQG